MSVIERVYLLSQKTKGNACQYFEVMEKGIDSAFHAWVIIEGIVVKVAELRDVSF